LLRLHTEEARERIDKAVQKQKDEKQKIPIRSTEWSFARKFVITAVIVAIVCIPLICVSYSFEERGKEVPYFLTRTIPMILASVGLLFVITSGWWGLAKVIRWLIVDYRKYRYELKWESFPIKSHKELKRLLRRRIVRNILLVLGGIALVVAFFLLRGLCDNGY